MSDTPVAIKYTVKVPMNKAFTMVDVIAKTPTGAMEAAAAHIGQKKTVDDLRNVGYKPVKIAIHLVDE